MPAAIDGDDDDSAADSDDDYDGNNDDADDNCLSPRGLLRHILVSVSAPPPLDICSSSQETSPAFQLVWHVVLCLSHDNHLLGLLSSVFLLEYENIDLSTFSSSSFCLSSSNCFFSISITLKILFHYLLHTICQKFLFYFNFPTQFTFFPKKF